MSIPIQIAFLITLFFFTLSGKVQTTPIIDADDFDIVIEPEDYEAEDDQVYITPNLWKRSGFWSSHPSDYNPMRRPASTGQSPRSGSKKSDVNPYHPIARTLHKTQKNQRSAFSMSPSPEELEAMFQGFRDKRQSPGSFLFMKLGRMNNKSAGGVSRRLGRRGRA